MKKGSLPERIFALFVLVSVGLLVGGTRACQEDYSIAGQTQKATATPIPSPTNTPSLTPTPGPTPTPNPLGTPTVTPTPEVDIGAARTGGGLYQQLSALSEGSALHNLSARAAGASSKLNENWLGKAFKGDPRGLNEGWSDSDGDGFSDGLERAHGADPFDATAVPARVVTTTLDQRIRSLDPDRDGLLTSEEMQAGTDPYSADSDLDGISDGAEVISGGDPVGTSERYADRDGDGLSDSYETENGSDPADLDTDADGLRDDLELVVGSDLHNPDSDGDGIADGKEFDLGSDPVLAEESR